MHFLNQKCDQNFKLYTPALVPDQLTVATEDPAPE